MCDIDALLSRLADARRGERRLMVGLAGPPASGKSTLATLLAERMNDAIVVPMDGFHLDNRLLDAAGLRDVKGAPETFDVAGLDALLLRIAADDGAVHVPLFDRVEDLSRAAAATVSPAHRIVLVEGNYLLLDEPVWRRIAGRFDLSVLIDVDEATLERRLIARWREHGLDTDAATARARSNDVPNGRRVLRGSMVPDIRYAS